mmetsp:Transcript_20238/g.34745  ORF Transcript_20238/g.34745 Transcript_20238/m.34745 type:complete len:387 (-) Transcript_20238:59-1219(-)
MSGNFCTQFCGMQHLVFVLLCIGLQASTTSAVGEMHREHLCQHDDACDDTVSMLQLRTEHPQSKSSTNDAPPNLAPWMEKEYHLIAQHKTGTVLSNEAALGMQAGATTIFPWLHPLIEASWSTMGFASDASMMQTPVPACHVHMTRNPFEMVVSGYKYHMSAVEPEWTTIPNFGDILDHDGCSPKYIGGRMSPICLHPRHGLQEYFVTLFYTGLANVYKRSHSGNLSAWFPEVKANESWSQYLQRVDSDAGLIANFIWASTTSLPQLRFVNDFVDLQPCSLNVCFNEWYDSCEATWSRVLTTWQIEEPWKTPMLAGANQSCPNGPDKKLADAHSSRFDSARAGVNTEESWRLVKRLRELDLLLFNGSLAALEKHIACPLSGHYKEK